MIAPGMARVLSSGRVKATISIRNRCAVPQSPNSFLSFNLEHQVGINSTASRGLARNLYWVAFASLPLKSMRKAG